MLPDSDEKPTFHARRKGYARIEDQISGPMIKDRISQEAEAAVDFLSMIQETRSTTRYRCHGPSASACDTCLGVLGAS